MPHNLKDVLPVTARVDDNDHLEIGGCDTTALAAEFGTPLFVFCETTFRQRAREFKAAFDDSTVYYAAKAFQCLGMSRLVESEGLGLDVASGGEMHTALAAGFPAGRMIFHGNNKSDAEIDRAVGSGIGRIALDNLEEVDRVQNAATAARVNQQVILRVTPGVEAHTHEYIQTGQEDSKFGLSIEGGLAEQAIKRALDCDALTLKGIHAHIGSNIFSYDPFGKTIEILFEFLAAIKSKFAIEFDEVNLGGGFGIPYLSADFPLRLELLSDLVRQTSSREAQRLSLKPPRLCFEPGRFLVGNAMATVYRVGTIKQIPGVRTYVSVDGGMSDNIRPALYQAHYSALAANKCGQPTAGPVTIAGLHCESGDILVRDAHLPESLAPGDLIAIPATGAYGYSMASNYNRQPRPAVVMVSDGQSKMMIRRESLDDLMRLDEDVRFLAPDS